jgi:hypothetical protein
MRRGNPKRKRMLPVDPALIAGVTAYAPNFMEAVEEGLVDCVAKRTRWKPDPLDQARGWAGCPRPLKRRWRDGHG